MFIFNRVLSITSENRRTFYNVVAARLCSDEYDRTPNGANMFEIGLTSTEPDEEDISDLTVTVGNAGWVRVQRGLNPNAVHRVGQGKFRIDEVDATVVNGLMVVYTKDGGKDDD